MTSFKLPDVVVEFLKAHEALREYFVSTGLSFTLDGKLVGDIGEAMAAQMFDLTLCERRTPGVDAHARDGRSVQVKATGRKNAGPAFTPGEGTADHLLFLQIGFASGTAEVAYNGPEAAIRELLPIKWNGTVVVPLARVLVANAKVPDHMRLKRIA